MGYATVGTHFMMTPKRGFSLRIFVPDGSPDGLRIVEKSLWTGTGVVCPRALFAQSKVRPEFQRTGVYLLLGPAEESGLQRVYVGEGDPVRPRLEQHAAKKEFWTSAILFSSKDANLNKAHVQYLEARLLQLATEAKRCQLDNLNSPALPSLSEADTAETEGFLDEILLCLPVLGVQVFEKPPVAAVTATLLYLKAKGVSATGYESAQGFVVRAGSQAVAVEVNSIDRYKSELRKALVGKGILESNGTAYQFTENYSFTSPSTAAGVILGSAASGPMAWKTADGVELKKLQEAEAG